MLFYRFVYILCIYINFDGLIYVYAKINKSNKIEYEKVNNNVLPAYIVASRADFVSSIICGKELQNFKDAVDQRILWSLKSK